MKKRVLSIVLSLCFILAIFLSAPVYAEGGITLNKTKFTMGEKVKATITGVTKEEIEADAYVGISPENEKVENTNHYSYVSDLPANNIWEFDAPDQFGKFEVRVIGGDYSLIAKTSFTVGGTSAVEGDIVISKKEAKLLEPISVTVNGLTKEQIKANAWLGIAKFNEKLENTSHRSYISELNADNTYKFEAPNTFGKYEVRVFSAYNEDNENSFFGKVEFSVIPSKAQPGDILISKASVRPNEKMSVTVKGLSKGEIKENAWLGISPYDQKLENTIHSSYISDLNINDSYEFNAPSDPGKYEVRVFCASYIEESEYEYGLFGKVQFIVSKDGKATGEIVSGYEGIAKWAVPEINKAVEENLVTEKVLTEFPKEITREEFCELAILLYEKITGKEAPEGNTNPFTDTQNPQVLKASNLGIVSGVGDGKFAPNNKVTRQEISAMLVRTLKVTMPELNVKAEFKTKFRDENKIAKWAVEAIRFMNSNEIIKGGVSADGFANLSPLGNTTRQEAIAMVLRTFNTFNKK